MNVHNRPQLPPRPAGLETLWEKADIHALLRVARVGMTDEELRLMAAVHTGKQVGITFDTLREIATTCEVPNPISPCTVESLHLARWKNPKSSDAAGHRRRLFACAVLLIAHCDSVGRSSLMGENTSCIVALDSMVALRGSHCMAFICWGMAALNSDIEEAPFVVMAMVLAAARLSVPEISKPDLYHLVHYANQCWQQGLVHLTVSPKANPKGLLDWTSYRARHAVWGMQIDATCKVLRARGDNELATAIEVIMRQGALETSA